MDNETGGSGAAQAREEAVTGGFVASIFDIFADPMKVFARIDAGLGWWKPFILIAVITILNTYLMMPFQRAAFLLNERGLSDEVLEAQLEQMDTFGFIGLIAAPIFVLIIIVIMAGISHLVINMMTSNASFKKIMSLYVFCGIISTVGQLLRTVVLMVRGVEAIQSSADINITFSLAALFPEMEGILASILESLGVFEIWFYVLLIIGIAAVFKISRAKAFVPAIVLWIISVALLSLRGLFGGGMGG
jgi:hypothetical protein